MNRLQTWIAGLFAAAAMLPSPPVSEIDIYDKGDHFVVELWTRGATEPVVIVPDWEDWHVEMRRGDNDYWQQYAGRPLDEVEKELE